jgi:hypothetical protein
VWEDIEQRREQSVIDFLRVCARTGMDRLSKPRQLEFMRWEQVFTKTDPPVLGFKEPVAWSIERNRMPYLTGDFLRWANARCIMMLRHPYDVVASGRARAIETRNWPNFTVEEHCQFWYDAVRLRERYLRDSLACLDIRFEELLCSPDTITKAIETFLSIGLPTFSGNERTPDYIENLRKGASPRFGLRGNANRKYLTSDDLMTIQTQLGEACEEFGYSL